jgi:hypothetical protein
MNATTAVKTLTNENECQLTILPPLLCHATLPAALDQDQDGRLAVGDLKAALEECHVSIGTDTLERVMQREGALDSRGMVSAKSFSVGGKWRG